MDGMISQLEGLSPLQAATSGERLNLRFAAYLKEQLTQGDADEHLPAIKAELE